MGGKFVEMPLMSRLFALAVMLLLFILPIPGTIALRHGLTLLALVLILVLWRPMRPHRADSSANMLNMVAWLTVITLWIVLQAGFFSEESRWAFKEITNQWLPALIAALIGWFSVICACASGFPVERVLETIVLIFLTQAAQGNGSLTSMLAAARARVLQFSPPVVTRALEDAYDKARNESPALSK
ncbi:MAG: hypothetical protein E6Q42_11230 [Dechloromonas sp.]|nr:MAG: hypothetical protein E6Q42_11230 [Dechloromonas sp.]